MAVVFDKYGEEPGLGAYHKDGRPYNEPMISQIKALFKDMVDPTKTHSISVHFINRAFNPVMCGVFGRELKSSVDCFKQFCDDNFIDHVENGPGDIIYLRFNLKAFCNAHNQV